HGRPRGVEKMGGSRLGCAHQVQRRRPGFLVVTTEAICASRVAPAVGFLPVLRNYRSYFLAILVSACVSGCGKKAAPPAAQAAAQNAQTNQAPGSQAPQPSAAAQQQASPPAESYETTVTLRSIEYL